MSMEQEFRLEAVLRHREHLEQNAQQAFSRAQGEWRDAKRTLDDLLHCREQYRRELATKLQRNFQAEEVIRYNRYLERLKSEVQQQRVHITQLAEAKERQRRLLVAAVKNRKIIENLKSRHMENRARLTREREQKLLGEASLTRHRARTGNAERDHTLPDPVGDAE
jgi:flagellar FliJ protein